MNANELGSVFAPLPNVRPASASLTGGSFILSDACDGGQPCGGVRAATVAAIMAQAVLACVAGDTFHIVGCRGREGSRIAYGHAAEGIDCLAAPSSFRSVCHRLSNRRCPSRNWSRASGAGRGSLLSHSYALPIYPRRNRLLCHFASYELARVLARHLCRCDAHGTFVMNTYAKDQIPDHFPASCMAARAARASFS